MSDGLLCRKFQLDPLTVPRQQRPPKRLDDGSEPAEETIASHYRQHYFKLLDKVTSCLSDRFPENSDLRVYRDVEQIILGKFVIAAERDVSLMMP